MLMHDPKSQGTDELVRADGRARLGLMLGPGSVLLAILVMLLVDLLDREPPDFSDRWNGNPSAVWAKAVALLLHVASFVEFVATVRVLRRPQLPFSVLALALYWVVLVWPITWYVHLVS